MRLPRTSVFRTLVGIGALAVWLWLTRTNLVWTLCGTLVIALSLHAADRRSRLANEIKTQEVAGKDLTFAGIIGYSIALFLGFAWVVSILVWDFYRQNGG